jgi:hypothetical protein
MKLSRRVFTIAVSALLLVAGVVIGLLPITATMTQVKPELRLLSVSCGNGFLLTTPSVQRGDLVALPGEEDVFLPRDSYAAHCSDAAGWRRYAAWGLTGIGVLGLALALSAGTGSGRSSQTRSPVSESGSAAGSGGVHRTRHRA